jgi:hypothetical protein
MRLATASGRMRMRLIGSNTAVRAMKNKIFPQGLKPSCSGDAMSELKLRPPKALLADSLPN